MQRRRKVLIVLSRPDRHALARLPALLRQVDVDVDLLSIGRGLANASRFTRTLPATPKDLPELVGCLREHLARHGEEYAFVMPGDDYLVDALCQETDTDWLRPWFPVDPAGEAFPAISRKDRFNQFCQRHGVSAPKNIVCQNFAEVEAAAAEIGFPVMLKGHVGAGGSDVQKADDSASLREIFLSHFAGRDLSQLSVQEFMPGRVGDCYVLAQHGKVVQWYSYYKTRTWPGRFGPSSVITTLKSPELDELCVRLAALTGFHGFFGFDWIESSRDGRFRIMEFNARITPAAYLGNSFGLSLVKDLPTLWGESDVSDCPHTISRPGMQRMFPQDFQRAIAEGDWRSFGRNLGETIFLRNDVPWQEPWLLGAYLKLIVKAIIKSCLPSCCQVAANLLKATSQARSLSAANAENGAGR